LIGAKTNMEVGQRVRLVNPGSGVQQTSTVISAQKSRGGGYAIAIEFDSPAPQLWSPLGPSRN